MIIVITKLITGSDTNLWWLFVYLLFFVQKCEQQCRKLICVYAMFCNVEETGRSIHGDVL